VDFIQEAQWFRPLYVISGVWQTAGWNSIIYIAALVGVDVEMHESAKIEGASRLQRLWYINLPSIMPTIMIVLILNVGQMMNIGFEKAFLMQNSLNLATADIISTYVYKIGIQGAQYDYSTAINLFNSVINCILLFTVNTIAKKAGETSLW
jgi:putative aldouronate transport system permease protein